jgi:potassium efflux system protein
MRTIGFVLFLLTCWSLQPSIAQAQSPVSPETGVTVELLENRIQEIEASSELDEESKNTLLDLYRKTIGLIGQRQSYGNATAEFVTALESAPQQSAALRQQLGNLETTALQQLPDELSRHPLPQLEQQLLSEKANLSVLSSSLAEIEDSLETQTQRSQLMRERLNEAKLHQSEIADALQLPPSEDQLSRLVEARRWSLEQEFGTLGAEIEMLNQELLSQPVRMELLGVQRDKATLELSRQVNYVELLTRLVAERRVSVAETVKEETEEIERQAFGKHELLQEVAQSNTQLSDELNRLVAELESVNTEENIAASRVKRVTDNFRLARQKLEIAGLSEAFGEVLLQQRRSLPDSKDFKAAETRGQRLVIDSGLRQLRNQQERARLRDINLYVDDLMADLSETWKSLLRADLLALAEQRRDLLDRAIAADDTYLQALGELDFMQRQLAETVTDFNDFLDERLLWIRTGERPSWQTLESIGQNIAVFVSPQHWLQLGRALVLPDSFPWVLLVGLAVFAFLMKITARLRTSLERSGRNVGQLRRDRYITTLRALMLTLVLALPWPVLFTALGLHFQFVQSIDTLDIETHIYQTGVWTGQFVPAIGAAFYKIALHTFYFVAFLIFCERGGLAVTHFGWNPATAKRLRHETRRLMWIFLPVVFVLMTTVSYDPAALAGGFSRLCFVIAMAALAWYFARILSPRHGVTPNYHAARRDNPVVLLRYLWVAFGFAIPVMLAVLATAGYTYTAVEFGARMLDTFWLIVAIILIHQLVVRLLLLTERQLAFNDALERHRVQRATQDEAEGEASGEIDHIQPPEEPEIDFGALSDDTSKLINTALLLVAAVGLLIIWSDIFPALSILDEVTLWHYSTVVNGVEQLAPVSLKDVIFGVVAILVIIVGARRLPALLEFVLLARLNITAGSRYAISTLTQYAIVTVGIVLVFNLLGGSWSEIQWLIAALGVGIGFGLQEIVANFICGLILLFERPIRIGDVVTVGNTDGVVTGIRIRSTTIRNWDRQELLVPNKEFVTGRLLNWTLSDPVTRIVIPVGIAYGSDVARAIQLVQEAADEHERVLDEPATLVTFDAFGDSSLTIVLRCLIGSMDYWRQTISELHQAIDKKFRDAGMVIAFPQRDIHLDTSNPLDVRIHRVQTETQE